MPHRGTPRPGAFNNHPPPAAWRTPAATPACLPALLSADVGKVPENDTGTQCSRLHKGALAHDINSETHIVPDFNRREPGV